MFVVSISMFVKKGTYVDDIYFDPINPSTLQMRVKPLVHLRHRLRRHHPDSVLQYLIHGEILHRHLQPLRQLRPLHHRLRHPRRPGPDSSPVAAERVPHVNILHRLKRLLQLPHKPTQPFTFLVIPELVILLVTHQPARHLFSGHRLVHPLLLRFRVMADALPPVVDQHEPRWTTAVDQPLHALLHAVRVHRQVKRVPRAPTELLHDSWNGFLF